MILALMLNLLMLKNGKIKILSRLRKIKVGLASVAVIVVLLLCGGTLTASAGNLKLVGKWNDDDFWYEPAAVTAELADVVAEYAGDTDLVPKSLPAGYLFGDLEVFIDESYSRISAEFYKSIDSGIDKIYIDYRFPFNVTNTPFYEKDFADVEEYEINGIQYYIMEDLDVRMIIWRNGIFEGSIKGSFSLAEAKEIINSIYGE